MKTQTKIITPQWASQILETRNPKNRPISKPFVERMARDMVCGAFATTHQGIAFDENGDLLDGQHRLAAVVKSGKPIEMVVTTGIPVKHKLNGVSVNTFELIDGGRKRGAGQMLSMAGFKNANRQAAMVRVLINACARPTSFLSVTTAQTHKALYYLKNSPEEIVQFGNSSYLLSPPCGVLAAIAFWHTFQPHASTLFADELSNVSGAPKSPSRALASWLKGRNIAGGNSSVQCAKATASAIYHQTQGGKVDRVYAADSALDWLLGQNKELAASLSEIINL